MVSTLSIILNLLIIGDKFKVFFIFYLGDEFELLELLELFDTFTDYLTINLD